MRQICLCLTVAAASALRAIAPTPRVHATFTAIPPRSGDPASAKYVALFGGAVGDNILTNDLHIFDAQKIHWEGGARQLDASECDMVGGTSCRDARGVEYDVRALKEDAPVEEADYINDKITGWPPRRREHAACAATNKLWIFGGWGNPERNGHAAIQLLNDLHAFDFDTMKWSGEISTIGGIRPSRRAGHTLTKVGDRCFLFGGTSAEGMMNDVHYFNCESTTASSETAVSWATPQVTGDAPRPRAYFTASAVGESIYIFGGEEGGAPGAAPYYDGEQPNRYSDIYEFNTRTMHWSKPATTGPSPASRSRHAAIVAGTSIFIIGGRDGLYQRQIDDVFEYRTTTHTWVGVKDPINDERVHTQTATNQNFEPGALPKRTRFNHSVAAYGDFAYFYGGSIDGTLVNDIDIFKVGFGHLQWLHRHEGSGAPGYYYGTRNAGMSAAHSTYQDRRQGPGEASRHTVPSGHGGRRRRR